MRKFEKFLFFYSITAATVLFISFGLFEPKPLNLISGILILPMIFYFWVKLTNPEKVSPEIWSLRFLAVIIIVSMLGIFGYYLAARNPIVLPTGNQILLNPVSDTIPAKTPAVVSPATSSGESITDIIYGTPTPLPTTFVVVKGNTAVNVYRDASTLSPVIGGLVPNESYPYSQKSGGWYKVYLNDSLQGWVSGSLVTEVQ